MEITIKVLKDGDKKVYYTKCDVCEKPCLYYSEQDVMDFVEIWL